MNRRKVIVVDDSTVMRQMLESSINRSDDLKVVATAPDCYEAWALIKQFEPDLLTLDVQMPRMDGLVFLERLMHLHPLPVVMVSGLTHEGSAATLRAMELGAVDFVGKPERGTADSTGDFIDEIIDKLRRAATLQPQRRQAGRPDSATSSDSFQKIASLTRSPGSILAIGGNSGGIAALRKLLSCLPKESPPVLVTQFIPAVMVKVLLARLQQQCVLEISEASNGQIVTPGQVLVAPPDVHMSVRRRGEGQYQIILSDGDRINQCRPSTDVLFESCANTCGARSIGILLAGIGKDGQAGLALLNKIGARAIWQQEAANGKPLAHLGEPQTQPRPLGIQHLALKDIPRALEAILG
jgi:two-component system, chemotaxis family, protein-glutamate methylesterase/glutaminase